MLFRTLIVDDEPIARSVLREELEEFDNIRIVGEAESALDALRLIETSRPNLVFLDLQMPGMSGFDVIQKVRSGPDLLVFIVVTAYNQFAIQAFESGAIDYLLKPIGPVRLAKAIEKVRRLLSDANGPVRQLAALQSVAPNSSVTGGSAHTVRRILAKCGSDYLLLSPDEVFAFQAEGDVVWISTERDRYLATETLRAIQNKLKDTPFKRVHRKALVNTDHIRKMSPLSSQRWLLTLSNGIQFIVSKRQTKLVRNLWRL